VRNYGIVLILLIIGNSFLEIIPWVPHFAGLMALLGGIFVYQKMGGSGWDFTLDNVGSASGDSELEVQVEPEEAPRKLNQKVRNHPARKEITIDRTNRDSSEYSDVARKVTINGKEKLFWGVIARPRNSKYSEKMRYIYNLTDDRIYKYDADIPSVEGRLDPFFGYTWLTKRGVNAKRDSASGGRNQIILDQRDSDKSSRPGNGSGGESQR